MKRHSSSQIGKGLLIGLLVSAQVMSAQAGETDLNALPKVLNGFAVNFFVKEPHIINPASLCFDKKGRLYVGAGPQYRQPKEDSPTDYIKILIDADGDGVAETVKSFAEGFNSIQSLVWRGDELWVANSPELTVLRDTNGDDVADEYKVIYTGLNNLRHGLHGMSWGPDGWLYMTLGNERVEDNAPLPIRQLQGITSDDKTAYPLSKTYSKDTYPKTYVGMKKREIEGGIFRCRPGGHDLELWARGMRNPWDMCFDASFNWLITDNDNGPERDRIFMPMQYAHHTYRHPWLFDWSGESLATPPASALFDSVSGSGTGVEWYMASAFPEPYRDSFLVADWTNNNVSIYKPKWNGALHVPNGKMVKLLDGGRNTVGDLNYKGGKGVPLFRPTDLKIGPAGDVYIAGWGSAYGTEYVPASKWTQEENAKYQGRVFRVRHESPLIPRDVWYPEKRTKDIINWTATELLADLGHQIEVWRVNAQDELVRRGDKVRSSLIDAIDQGSQSDSQQTWSIWTLGRIDAQSGETADLMKYANGDKGKGLNLQLQALRILGENKAHKAISLLIGKLHDPEPRLRLAALQSLTKTGLGEKQEAVLAAIANESDRCTAYMASQVLKRTISLDTRRALLRDPRAGVRLAVMIGMMEEKTITPSDVIGLQFDADERVNIVARLWQAKTGNRGVTAVVTIDAPEPSFRDSTEVRLICPKGFVIRYSTDGSEPGPSSLLYTESLRFTENAELKAAAFLNKDKISETAEITLHRISESEWKDRLFIRHVRSPKGHGWSVSDDGMQRGVNAYASGSSTIVELPDVVAGATQLRLHPDDRKNADDNFLSFDINIPATLYVAYEAKQKPPAWLLKDFVKTADVLKTSEGKNGAVFDIYRKAAAAGSITIGGPAHQDAKSPAMPLVFLTKATVAGKTDAVAVKAALASADMKRGEELFFGRGTCFVCHQVGGRGIILGPELNDIAKRHDINYVIQSILEPDVYIVEGFQQTSLVMKDGAKLFGMVQENTEQSVTLFLATGQKVTVRADDIKSRDDAKVSGMPSSFTYTLSPQDVADISTWLIKRGAEK